MHRPCRADDSQETRLHARLHSERHSVRPMTNGKRVLRRLRSQTLTFHCKHNSAASKSAFRLRQLTLNISYTRTAARNQRLSSCADLPTVASCVSSALSH